MINKQTIKEKFIKKYKSLTKGEKNTIMMYFNGEPYTWNPVWLEVSQGTPMGDKMLEQWDFYSTEIDSLLDELKMDLCRRYQRYGLEKGRL